jgi:hypothetical protein
MSARIGYSGIRRSISCALMTSSAATRVARSLTVRAILVGVIFDGNLHSLIWDIAYTDDQARAIAVHSSAIVEALDKVYDARGLLGELLQR